MSEPLKNPELPPGAIVETYEDGGALRNDGVTLTPASQNPWYVLATVAGEQEGTSPFVFDADLHAKNRRFWNGWMCQGMKADARAALAKKLDLPHSELGPLSEEQMEAVKARFKTAFPKTATEEAIPTPAKANFSRVYFTCPLILVNFHFTGIASFGEAHFTGTASFEAAHFTARTNFNKTHFAGDVYLQATHFTGPADFNAADFASGVDFRAARFNGDATFNQTHFSTLADFHSVRFNKNAFFRAALFNWDVNFRKACFSGCAVFRMTYFTDSADFGGAYFTGPSVFQDAKFKDKADFSDGCFKAQTVFDGVDFKGEVPRFFHREMHQDTAFTDDPKLWPEVTAKNAKAGKRAYTRLRQVAAEIYDPDLEHFFLRQEMRCKARIEWDKGAWFHWLFFEAYRVIADSGISVARPFWLLVFAWAFGVACFAGHFDSGVLPEMPEDIQDSRYWAAAGVSFGNLFGFLGINRLYFTEVLRDHSPDGLQFVAGAQTVAGVVLLFFLGLGLRNRFRLK